MTKHKFVYTRAILRTALGAAPQERPTANSIRIAAAVQKHSIRNKPALPACQPGSRMALTARRFPVREPMYNAYGIEDQLYDFIIVNSFRVTDYLPSPSKNFHARMLPSRTRFSRNADSSINFSADLTLTRISFFFFFFFKAHHQ